MKVIMTASKSSVPAEINARNNQFLLDFIDRNHGITGHMVDGYWKGEREISYMFEGVTSRALMSMMFLARDFEQDAILVIADDGRAYLYNNHGADGWDSVDIGDYQQVEKEVAVQFDGYTFDRSRRAYFVAATRKEIAAKRVRLLATQAAVIAAQEYEARLSAMGV